MLRNSVGTRRIAMSLCAAIFGTLLLAASANAATKPYAVVFSPGTVSSGSATITAKLVDENSQQSLGSANLTPPPGFTVTNASLSAGSPGTAAVVANVVQVRNLSLASGHSLNVTMTANTPQSACSTATYTWSIAAKQANNFSGTGNDFTPDAANSSTTTAVTTACALKFGTQPHNAVVAQHITGTDYDDTGSPLTVQVVDANNDLVTSANASVTITLGKNPGGAALGGTQTISAVGGVATFSDLTLNKPDPGYTLKASAAGLTGATSGSFTIVQTATPCTENVNCQSNVNNGTTNATVLAQFDPSNPDSGVLTESLDTGPPLVCAGYTPAGPDWISFFMDASSRTKVVTMTVKTDPAGETAFGGDPDDAQMEACFGAPYEFRTKAGTPAPLVTYADGSTEYVGLLPNCPITPAGPCVSGRKDDDSVPQTTVQVTIPAGLPGDPRMHR